MNPSYYKYCIVPKCKSTSIKTPGKLFIYVPNKPQMRRKWLKLARRDGGHCLSTNTRMYFCEDHFNLQNDMLNYTEYHIMGKVSQVRMIPGCTPTKFECQEDRRKRTCSSTERPYILKKQRMTTIAECLNEPDESPTLSSSPTDNPHTSSADQMASPQRSPGAEGSGLSRTLRVSVKVEPVEEPGGPRAPHDSTRGNSCFTHFGHNTWDHTYATDFPTIGVCVKQEPESNESADVIKEEAADVIKEEGGDEAAKEESASAGARGSEAAMLAALYADHVVKDELVLGPEVPNRPHITSLHDARGVSGGASREPRGGQLALKDCSVRLERCDAPRGAATREPAPESRAPRHGTAPHARTELNAANTYVCDICGKLFKRKHDIIRHVNGHLRENLEVLSNIYKRVRASVKPHACDICNKKFPTLGYLRRHHRDHPAPNTYVCDICGKRIKRKDHLIRHVNRHLRENSEVLSNKSNIYERVRTSVKYACEICNKDFSRLDNLQRHQRVHTGDKPYSCEICHNKFAQIGNLKAHKRIHTLEKPYSCDICNKQFAQCSTMSKHKRTHTGEKSYSCVICKKNFGYFDSLKRHKRIHTGATPYTCEICEEGFMRVDTLKIHLKSHIRGKPEIKQKKPRRKGQRNST